MINIIGSKELDLFGAKLNNNMLIPYISGVVPSRISDKEHKMHGYISGIVRIPLDAEIISKKPSYIVQLFSWIKLHLTSRHGVLYNIIMVVVHVAMILLVPTVVFIIFVWGLQQVEIVDQHIYQTSYTFNDVIYPSYYDYWYHDIPIKTLFWIVAGSTIAFIVIGFFDLASYYATNVRNTGKYIVSRSFLKTALDWVFWVFLLFYILIYAAYISVILGWWLVGAILSPEKFLPVAMTSLTLIIFTYLLYSKLKKINNDLSQIISGVVSEEIGNRVIAKVEKEQDKMLKVLSNPISKAVNAAFEKQLNTFMKDRSFKKISPNQISHILMGDENVLIQVI